MAWFLSECYYKGENPPALLRGKSYDAEPDVGFSPNLGFRLLDKSSDSQDDNNGTTPVVRPRPGNPPQPGGQAKSVPKSGQGATPKVDLKPGKQVRPDAAADTQPPKGRRPRRSQSKDEQTPNVNIRFG